MFNKINNENLDFDFVKGKEEPSYVKIFDCEDPNSVNINARIRDIDDNVMLVSPLVIPTCDGHFVTKIKLTQAIKNRFTVALRCANITAEGLMKDIEKFLKLQDYNRCQFNLHCDECNERKATEATISALGEINNTIEGVNIVDE